MALVLTLGSYNHTQNQKPCLYMKKSSWDIKRLVEGHGVNYTLAQTIGSLAPSTEPIHSISTEKLGKKTKTKTKKQTKKTQWSCGERKIDQEDFRN